MTSKSRLRLLALIALAAAATSLMAAAPAGAITKVVYAGPASRSVPGLSSNTDFDAFFRRTVTINAGDSVRWQFRGFHNVAFVPPGQAPPPLVAPDPSRPVAGLRDAAGAPFWFNGQPSLPIPAQVAGRLGPPVVSGLEYHNSGLPMGPRTPSYTLRFSRVGTYRYLCTVHPGMTGTVRVLPRGRPVPSAFADFRARTLEQLAAGRLAMRLRRFSPTAYVAAGNDAGPVTQLRFFPAFKTVRVGQAVRFVMRSSTEPHTVTFGPAALRSQLERDLVTMSPGAPGQPPRTLLNPLAFYPSDPPPTVPPYTGANHGNGFLNTGQLDRWSFTPFPSSATITFTKVGTYAYVCVIHPGMAGQIRVVR